MLKQYECPLCHGVVEAVRDLVPKKIVCPHCKDTFTLGAGKPEVGVTVAGYRIEEKLGSGGMGDVWLATQLSMDRRVALKILPSNINQSPEAVLAFTREARLLAKLDHPNIVTAFDFGEFAGLYYLAMTYVEGEDLASLLEKRGTLPEPEALMVALKMAQALQYAWTQFKLLHRDVNPSNIMIDRYGDVRLMDLGIGKTVQEGGDADVEQHLVGTPNYMSPEQAEGRSDLDCRADMYSLGASLYHMLTGQVPFDDPDPQKVLALLRTQTLPAINRNVSPECAALVTRLMQHDREQRFATWDEAVKMLKEFNVATRVGTAETPAPSGLAGVPQDTGGKKPALIVLGFLLLGVFLGLAALSMMGKDPGPDAVIPPPSENEFPPPEERPSEPTAEEVEALRQAEIQHIHIQVKAARAYLQGAEPDFEQALQVLGQLRSSAEALGVEEVVLDEINRIRKQKNQAQPDRPPEVTADSSARPLNGQEQARLAALINASGRDIYNREFQSALSRVRDAGAYDWPDIGKKRLKRLREGIQELASVKEQVRLSFAAEVGKEIIVPLTSGREKLRIVDAGRDPVVAEIVLRKNGEPFGAVRCEVDIGDLEIEEQIRRVGYAESPQAPLLRSLMALSHQDYARARSELEDYEGLFAEPFLAELRKQLN